MFFIKESQFKSLKYHAIAITILDIIIPAIIILAIIIPDIIYKYTWLQFVHLCRKMKKDNWTWSLWHSV